MMEGVDRTMRRKKSLKERLGFNGLSCCGGVTWGLGPTTMSVRDDEEDQNQDQDGPINPETTDPNSATQTPPENSPSWPCDSQSAAVSGMNLAAALAAERQLRAEQESEHDQSPSPNSGTPPRMSLMRLLEETAGRDEGRKEEEDGGGCDRVCCVCMGRKKGAAFIPCGHTFCRVCSRELWLNRGTCPLCNRSILEILDIY